MYKLILAHSHSSQPNLGFTFKSLNVLRLHSKHFEVSVLQSKKSKSLRIAKKNASLAKSCIYHSPPLVIKRDVDHGCRSRVSIDTRPHFTVTLFHSHFVPSHFVPSFHLTVSKATSLPKQAKFPH